MVRIILFSEISNEYTGKITQLSLNAFGFVNNTCTCSNFGFLPKPEWSDKLGQPYCRCDTRNRIFKQMTRQNPSGKELNPKKVVFFSIISMSQFHHVFACHHIEND